MCGCERKYSYSDLISMNKTPSDRIKCKRKKLQCNNCKNEVNILFKAKYSYSCLDKIIKICLYCIKRKHKENTSNIHIKYLLSKSKDLNDLLTAPNIITSQCIVIETGIRNYKNMFHLSFKYIDCKPFINIDKEIITFLCCVKNKLPREITKMILIDILKDKNVVMSDYYLHKTIY